MEIFIFKKLFLLQYLVIFVLGILNWNGFNVEGLTNYSDFSTLLSAVKYSKIRLHHYDWRYIRVELPNGFSSLSMTLTTDWVSGKRDLFDLSNDTIPLVCIRYGGPPLAESAVKSESSTALFDGYVHNMSNMGQCTSFQESMRVNLTEEQVFSRILYLGFFNGVGPIRTQSKMINRGSTYTVDIELVILGCRSSFLGGPYCNNTINSLTCPQVGLYNHPRRLHENPLSGKKHWKTGDLYPLGKSPAQQLGRTEGSCLFNCSKSIDGKRNKGISDSNGRGQIEKKENLSESAEHELICSNSQGKECIKNGEWKFFALEVVDISSLLELMVEYENFNSSNDNAKQTEVEATIYVRYNSLPQKALYEYSLPVGQSNLSIQFPKLGRWYIGSYFSNTSKQSGAQDQEKEEGTLCFVLKWRIYACSLGKAGDGCRWEVNTLKVCPNYCSEHGTCEDEYEESGLTSFSFCYCDGTHGGFDCSKELISPTQNHGGQIWQSATLVVSNIAAILPVSWCIHHKAYSESILYTTSGISSAIYHSCDSGIWCALSFDVLQFMDFWLSFMAIEATCIYMASMDDKTKVAVHIIIAIITALMAVNDPTRSINIILIAVIGILLLLFGWIMFCRSDLIAICHSFHHSTTHERWQTLRTEAKELFKKLVRRYRWRFIGVGFLLLVASVLSKHFETVQTYWYRHSLWHVGIYTSSLVFLCSSFSAREIYEQISSNIANTSSLNDTGEIELADQ